MKLIQIQYHHSRKVHSKNDKVGGYSDFKLLTAYINIDTICGIEVPIQGYFTEDKLTARISLINGLEYIIPEASYVTIMQELEPEGVKFYLTVEELRVVNEIVEAIESTPYKTCSYENFARLGSDIILKVLETKYSITYKVEDTRVIFTKNI